MHARPKKPTKVDWIFVPKSGKSFTVTLSEKYLPELLDGKAYQNKSYEVRGILNRHFSTTASVVVALEV